LKNELLDIFLQQDVNFLLIFAAKIEKNKKNAKNARTFFDFSV
jgi:hypothetical protein